MLDLTKFANFPVCISTQSDPKLNEVLISLIDGLMNKLVLIFFFLNLKIIFFIFDLFFLRFNPPSVVTSFLFSGTIQIKFGFIVKAFFIIS